MRSSLLYMLSIAFIFFFFQAEDGIRDDLVTGVQTCALPIYWISVSRRFFIRCFMKMNVAVNMAIHSNILNGLKPGSPNNSGDRKSTRLNSSHQIISYAVFCLKKKTYPPMPINRETSLPLIHLTATS